MRNSLILLDEPLLEFGHSQCTTYAKDGLLLFGPPSESGQPKEIRYGAIGTRQGLKALRGWIRKISTTSPSQDSTKAHFQFWPGFSAVFGANWPLEPLAEYVLDDKELSKTIRLKDRHHAIFKTAGLFENVILRHGREEERQPDLWLVVIPDEVCQ